MWRVIDNLVLDHDLRLVLLAAAICAFGTVSTMNVSSRASGKKRTALWLVLLSVCAAATVWSTHFIAMLAYKVNMPMTYDAGLTALSFVAGAAVMGLGFFTAMRFRRASSTRLLGGAIFGLGVVLLHYVGMAALRMPGHLTYSSDLVAASVVFSLGFGALSLFVEFGPSRSLGRVTSTLLMIAMIVTLHFTAMGAVNIEHGLVSSTGAEGVSRSVLVTAVAVASLFILLIAMTGALIDQRVSRRLAAEADRFRTLAEGAFEGIVVHRAGMIVDANSVARQMFGLTEHAAGQSILDWFTQTTGEHAVPLAGGADDRTMELVLRRPDGSTFPAEICRRRILLTDGAEGELFAVRDITSRKEAEARLAHLALHDSLTDMPNRRFFMELAQKNISLAQRTGERFALLAVDLDDFKLINDIHGHAAGDELIRVTAKRIAATVRDADISARFGGRRVCDRTDVRLTTTPGHRTRRATARCTSRPGVSGWRRGCGQRVDWRRALSGRWKHRSGSSPQCGYSDVPCQGRRQRRHRASSNRRWTLRSSRDEARAGATSRRGRKSPIRRLPADRRQHLPNAPRLRGSGALARRGDGPDHAGRLHPGGGRDWSHRVDRRVRAASRMLRCHDVADATSRGGQSLGRAVQAERTRGHRSPSIERQRSAWQPAGARGDGNVARGEP
jgi:PAS domain S-box-containing protein